MSTVARAGGKGMKHSPSSIKQWQTCPRQYAHLRIWKDVEDDPDGSANLHGQAVHEALRAHALRRLCEGPLVKGEIAAEFATEAGKAEERAASLADLAGTGRTLVPKRAINYIDQALRQFEVVGPESPMALDRDLLPCSYEEGWIRGRADLVCHSHEHSPEYVRIVDWKTGRSGFGWGAMMFYALCQFLECQDVQRVEAVLFWTRTGEKNREAWTREDIPALKRAILTPVREAEAAESYPAKPNWKCDRFCPVPKSKCGYSGRDTRSEKTIQPGDQSIGRGGCLGSIAAVIFLVLIGSCSS